MTLNRLVSAPDHSSPFSSHIFSNSDVKLGPNDSTGSLVDVDDAGSNFIIGGIFVVVDSVDSRRRQWFFLESLLLLLSESTFSTFFGFARFVSESSSSSSLSSSACC
jgi:hypothetical protein